MTQQPTGSADRSRQRRVARRLRAPLSPSAPHRDPDGSRPPATSRPARVGVPGPVRAATEWTWRGLLLALGAYVIFRVLASVALVTLAVLAAVLLTALLHPAVDALCRARAPRLVATMIVFISGLAVLALVGWFVTNRLLNRVADISSGLQAGIAQVRGWLENGPLHLTAGQVENAIDTITTNLLDGAFGQTPLDTATTAAKGLSGIVLTLFLLFFFLYDGSRIWAWTAHLFPRRAEKDVGQAGRRAWAALTGYVRGTVLVALVEGILIGLTLFAVGVPLAVSLGVLTFLAAFIPILGAFVAGAVAVLVTLVTNGATTALLVLAVFLLVQQLEGNLLAPLILGHAVHLHPVAIALSVAVGGLVAGIPGAVIAVPAAATTNTVLTYLLTDRDTARPQLAPP